MMSNIWIEKSYRDRVNVVIEEFNTFEVASFFEHHRFRDANEQTEENTQDHDITIVDEISFEVFVEHLDCYFKIR